MNTPKIDMIILENVSPSGDKVKVVVEGDRVSLLMTSPDGRRITACDNIPEDVIALELIALRRQREPEILHDKQADSGPRQKIYK